MLGNYFMCQSDVAQMLLIYSFLWKNCPKPKEYTVHGSVVLVAQSCVTLCVPKDCSPAGSSVHGILLARILEWISIPSSKISSWPRDRTWVSYIVGRLFTVWATGEAVEAHMVNTTLYFSTVHTVLYLWTNIIRSLLLFSHWVLSDSFATPWIIACQAPLLMRLPRQEYWSGLPVSSLGNLSDSRIELVSPTWQECSFPLSHQGNPIHSEMTEKN